VEDTSPTKIPRPVTTQLSSSSSRFIKDYIYTSPLPQPLTELQSQISNAIALVDAAMLHCSWGEFQYCLDIYHVTHGEQNEYLQENLSLHVAGYFNVVTAPLNNIMQIVPTVLDILKEIGMMPSDVIKFHIRSLSQIRKCATSTGT
jgi:hypothetical protein